MWCLWCREPFETSTAPGTYLIHTCAKCGGRTQLSANYSLNLELRAHEQPPATEQSSEGDPR